MESLADLAALLLTSVGMTVVIVWPEAGPTAFLRERALRRLIPASARGVLDCYICTGFWIGLLLSPIWWMLTHAYWSWCSSFMTAGLFWILLGNPLAEAGASVDISDD